MLGLRQNTCAGGALAKGQVQAGQARCSHPPPKFARGRIFIRLDEHRDNRATAYRKETERMFSSSTCATKSQLKQQCNSSNQSLNGTCIWGSRPASSDARRPGQHLKMPLGQVHQASASGTGWIHKGEAPVPRPLVHGLRQMTSWGQWRRGRLERRSSSTNHTPQGWCR